MREVQCLTVFLCATATFDPNSPDVKKLISNDTGVCVQVLGKQTTRSHRDTYSVMKRVLDLFFSNIEFMTPLSESLRAF